MKQRLTTFAYEIDALCAELNHGLTAIAVVVGFFVLAMSVVRLEELAPDFLVPGTSYQLAAE